MEKAIKERRLTELRALEENNEMIVEGYAVVFESMTDLGYFKEIIDKRAFDICNMQDVCMKYNHLDIQNPQPQESILFHLHLPILMRQH